MKADNLKRIPGSLFSSLIALLVMAIAFSLGYIRERYKEKPVIRIEEGSFGEEVPLLGAYIGSKESKKYGFPWCSAPERLKVSNREMFQSEEEAGRAGYTPYKVCKGLEGDKNPKKWPNA